MLVESQQRGKGHSQ